MLNADPMKTWLQMEAVPPSLLVLLTLSELPSSKVSRMEICDPRRTVLLMESELPSITLSITESVRPACHRPNTETPEPRRANPRIDILEPRVM
jgi:hypothetical protein